MSTRGLKRPTTRGCTAGTRRRKLVLDVDLNVDPPIESRLPEGASLHGNPDDGHVGRQDASSSLGGRMDNALIDVEALEDEVVIFSPRSFREVRNQSRRNPATTVVLDEDSDVQPVQSGSVAEEPVTRLAFNSYYSHSRNSTSETIINCELYIEGNSNARRRNPGRHHVEEPNKARSVTNPILDLESQAVAPPKEEPTFSCAVCMGPLVEATSTTCGHIFCRVCIKAAIAAQKKCPTCRRKLCQNNVHRIYLPAIN